MPLFVIFSLEEFALQSSPFRRLYTHVWDGDEKGCGILFCKCLQAPGKDSYESWVHFYCDFSFSVIIIIQESCLPCLLELAFNTFCVSSEIKYTLNRGRPAMPSEYLEKCSVASEGKPQRVF